MDEFHCPTVPQNKRELIEHIEQPHRELLYKVCIIGDEGVGKTCFVRKCSGKKTFDENTKPSTEIDFGLKVIKGDNYTCRLQLWDIPERAKRCLLTSVYYRETRGVFVVIDPTKRSTIDEAIKWKEHLEQSVNLPALQSFANKPIILLVTKADELDDQTRSLINYDEFCKTHQIHAWYFISSKTGENVEEACGEMDELLRDTHW